MATKTTTTQCPGKVCTCGGTEQVTVRRGMSKDRATGTRRPTIVYGPCAPLVAQGWGNGPALVEWDYAAAEEEARRELSGLLNPRGRMF